MQLTEALQQLSDNQIYVLGLLNQLRMGTIHPDAFTAELSEVIALSQECIESLAHEMNAKLL